jgi:DNA repair protein RecO (recombination protein O)
MALLVTDAIVLHVFDYLESSRILRLATRDAGVQSVLARGARRPKSRFGGALDLFTEGSAQIHTKPGRDLQTLGSFDVERARPALAADLGRFTGAATVAELALRFASDDANPALFDVLREALDAIAAAEPPATRAATLAGAWRLVAELGFAPSLDSCNVCGADLRETESVTFSHPAGGVLCPRCARLQPGGRALPLAARRLLRRWLSGERNGVIEEDAVARAHQRLLREFIVEHLVDRRALRAFEVWEHAGWEAR